MKILTIAEQGQGKWNNTSFETLVAAQQIAVSVSGTVSAAVVGKNVASLAQDLATKDVSEVLLVEHELLETYTPDGYCTVLKQVIEAAAPDLVVFPHTYQVRDFAPALAAMLGKGMVGDCIGFRNEGGKLVFVRQMFQGRMVADVTFTGAGPWFASFQSGAFRADSLRPHPSGKAPLIGAKFELKAQDIRTKPLERFKEATSAVDLTQAAAIVAIGAVSRNGRILRRLRRWRRRWGPRSRQRGRFVTKAGCRWSARLAARGRRSRQNCTLRWESAAPYSTLWG